MFPQPVSTSFKALSVKNCIKLFLDNICAGILTTPGIHFETMLMLKCGCKETQKEIHNCFDS